ncbi:hypothetical protein AMATHDRAFT_147977 [Amanita thiersii Skay4041]|uniref:Uncharacterized protein n=1 Tax=Amanita thiersii Skay4041 TaxID=703135 RepID=A0A2A9NLX9_9AGAR|nr:hypothetical protein AMATHDRAFT_147977 [Amanita thiersii Skay4041]
MYSVFWAERVTIRKRFSVSPYFAVTGAHPLLPLDIVEATYLSPPPTAFLSTTELITRRAIKLQKCRDQLQKICEQVYSARVTAAKRFEQEHPTVIKDFDFKKGDLVLIRNTAIEKALNKKMQAQYIGPLVVIARNKGGAYLIAELDGSVMDRPIAAFRVLPYFVRKCIDVPSTVLDISLERICEMQNSASQGDEDIEEENQAKEDNELENKQDLL